ncbi:hypothetical protein FSP39_007346 [Pinctada imbricata]|uniref:Palmitoyltransferase n=1 Tax=Pinctada imbricata TaxID=66713 RepID=A0AA88YL74_PINIB|nr:hypothetical protein FSP39_007346 [Pinctada imbricata]
MSEEALCCCEFEDEKGERSHILACCCNCEAVDQACDSFITCKGIPDDIAWRIIKTFEDRCRIPGFLGGGARKLPIGSTVPVIAIPLCLTIGTIGPIFTCLVLLSMPICMLYFYGLWRRNSTRPRTQFFFAWGVVSVLMIAVCFELLVVPKAENILFPNIFLLDGLFAMFYYLRKARKRTSEIYSFQFYTESFNNNVSPDVAVNLGGDNSLSKPTSLDELTAVTVPESEVTWLDSRPIIDGKLSTWCPYCKIQKPFRSGHCNICKSCISVRDHHCVWIDTCVGSKNHRPFLAAMTLFVIFGYYGSHVTLTTICISTNDWIPYQCSIRDLYLDFSSALCFVSVTYTLLCTSIMSMGLLQQCIFISQNVTSQEFHMATKRRWLKYGFIAKNNQSNTSFLKNWMNFLFTERRMNYDLEKL